MPRDQPAIMCMPLVVIESYEALLYVIGDDVFDSTGLYLGIELILCCCWLQILFQVTIDVLFLVLT